MYVKTNSLIYYLNKKPRKGGAEKLRISILTIHTRLFLILMSTNRLILRVPSPAAVRARPHRALWTTGWGLAFISGMFKDMLVDLFLLENRN